MKKKTAQAIAQLIYDNTLKALLHDNGVITEYPNWKHQFALKLVLRSGGDWESIHNENCSRTPGEFKEFILRYMRATKPAVREQVRSLYMGVKQDELEGIYDQCADNVAWYCGQIYSGAHIEAVEFIRQNAKRPEGDKWDAAKELQEIKDRGEAFIQSCRDAAEKVKFA